MKPETLDLGAEALSGVLSIAEIAKLTGEQFTTIEARVYRALRKLRAALSSA